jgi:hypothetical protein
MRIAEAIASLRNIHIESADDDLMSAPIDDSGGEKAPDTMNIFDDANDGELLKILNDIYTGVMITQEIEGDLSSRITEAYANSKDSVVMERNIFKFDKSTRMAQLISICEKLKARQKNTEAWQSFVEGSRIRKESAMRMHEEENAGAVALAHKYLDQVSANSTSSVARNAAQALAAK